MFSLLFNECRSYYYLRWKNFKTVCKLFEVARSFQKPRWLDIEETILNEILKDRVGKSIFSLFRFNKRFLPQRSSPWKNNIKEWYKNKFILKSKIERNLLLNFFWRGLCNDIFIRSNSRVRCVFFPEYKKFLWDTLVY